MSVTYVDGTEVIRTVLDDNWDARNHHGAKPSIKIIYNEQKISQARKPTISIMEVVETINYDYSARIRHDENLRISIDVRAKARKTMKSVTKEIKKILEENQSTIGDITMPAGVSNGYNQVWIVSRNDLSNRRENFHREVIDVELWKLGVVRSKV